MKRGLYETQPPLKPEEEKNIKGRDASSSEVFPLKENMTAKKVVEATKSKLENLKGNLTLAKELLPKKIKMNDRLIAKFNDFLLKTNEFDDSLEGLALLENADKYEQLALKIRYINSEITRLENWEKSLEDEIKKLETEN